MEILIRIVCVFDLSFAIRLLIFFGILTGNEREFFFLSVNWSQDDSKITDKITNDAKSILKIQINGFRFAMITCDISYASTKHMIVSWFHTILCGLFGGEITTQIQKSPKSLWIPLEKPIKCVSHLTAYEKRANRETERNIFPSLIPYVSIELLNPTLEWTNQTMLCLNEIWVGIQLPRREMNRQSTENGNVNFKRLYFCLSWHWHQHKRICTPCAA